MGVGGGGSGSGRWRWRRRKWCYSTHSPFHKKSNNANKQTRLSVKMSDDHHVVQAGKKVEVLTIQPGRVNTYYPATCLEIRGEKCRVKHDSKKDEHGFRLVEVIPLDMVRPEPPPITCSDYRVGDIVDYKHAGGWWKGKVSQHTITGTLWVTFDHAAVSGECYAETLLDDRLRVHQEWNRYNPGEWVCSKVFKKIKD